MLVGVSTSLLGSRGPGRLFPQLSRCLSPRCCLDLGRLGWGDFGAYVFVALITRLFPLSLAYLLLLASWCFCYT